MTRRIKQPMVKKTFLREGRVEYLRLSAAVTALWRHMSGGGEEARRRLLAGEVIYTRVLSYELAPGVRDCSSTVEAICARRLPAPVPSVVSRGLTLSRQMREYGR